MYSKSNQLILKITILKIKSDSNMLNIVLRYYNRFFLKMKLLFNYIFLILVDTWNPIVVIFEY
jgi:hypothetical protein